MAPIPVATCFGVTGRHWPEVYSCGYDLRYWVVKSGLGSCICTTS